MTVFEIVAQAIGIVAMAFNIFSYQQKTSTGVILCQGLGGLLFSVSFFMLGATVGGILNAIGAVRAVVFMYRDKLRADHILWLMGFIGLYVISYILTFTVFGKDFTAFNAVLELLPVIGMTASNIGFRLANAKAIRRFGLISSPSWLIYNTINLAAGAIICEVLSLFSIVIGILRYDVRRKESSKD